MNDRFILFIPLGDASITFFEIKCSGWLDEEDRNTMADAQDHNALLTYKVYQRTVRNGTRINSLLEESSKLLFNTSLPASHAFNPQYVTYLLDTHVQSFDMKKKRRISAVRCR